MSVIHCQWSTQGEGPGVLHLGHNVDTLQLLRNLHTSFCSIQNTLHLHQQCYFVSIRWRGVCISMSAGQGMKCRNFPTLCVPGMNSGHYQACQQSLPAENSQDLLQGEFKTKFYERKNLAQQAIGSFRILSSVDFLRKESSEERSMSFLELREVFFNARQIKSVSTFYNTN